MYWSSEDSNLEYWQEMREAIVKDYNELLQSQDEATDWPHPGMQYKFSDSAADERFEYWRLVREQFGEEFADWCFDHWVDNQE